jgi:hypothetical protein
MSQPRDLTREDRRLLEKALLTELHRQRERFDRAKDEFAGLAPVDGAQNPSKEFIDAFNGYSNALKEFNDFILRGRIPPQSAVSQNGATGGRNEDGIRSRTS